MQVFNGTSLQEQQYGLENQVDKYLRFNTITALEQNLPKYICFH